MRRLSTYIPYFVPFIAAVATAGCASSPVARYQGDAPKTLRLYVIASGWHTEIGVPANALAGPLASLRQAAPEARYFIFGWGERDYYMAANPGLGDLLAAALPGPSVMLVIPIARSPSDYFAGSSVFAVPASQEGLDRLAQFVWDDIDKDSEERPRRIGDGPDAGSSFYGSTGTYSLANTCNSWTAEALQVAGLPVNASGVLFAHQVVDQVRDLTPPP